MAKLTVTIDHARAGDFQGGRMSGREILARLINFYSGLAGKQYAGSAITVGLTPGTATVTIVANPTSMSITVAGRSTGFRPAGASSSATATIMANAINISGANTIGRLVTASAVSNTVVLVAKMSGAFTNFQLTAETVGGDAQHGGFSGGTELTFTL